MNKLVLRLLLLPVAVATGACGGGGSQNTPSDTTPPTVISTDPPSNAVGVPVADPIVATFSEFFDLASVDANSFFIRDSAGATVNGAITRSGRTAQFTPRINALARASRYTATLTTGIKDVAGNHLAADHTWSFSTTTDAWQSTATIAAPPARVNHAAVWTGSSMIIWGGEDAAGPLASGGRYDPSINTWSDTATTNAPSARTGHTAIWTSGEMLVWGGLVARPSTFTNTGARYTPSTNTWAVMPTTAAPEARSLHTAVWSETEMIVWGGITAAGATNTGGRFNPATATWTPTSTSGAPVARSGHTAVWTGAEMIVWGGTIGGAVTQTGGRYRPDTNTWTSLPTVGAPTGRAGHTAVWTGTQMIVWGGADSLGMTRTGASYDPATNTWTPINNTDVDTPSARRDHTAVWTGTEMIVWGGDSVDTTGAAYRPTTDTWRTPTTTNAPDARAGHSAIWSASEMILWGGQTTTSLLTTGARYAP